MYTLDYSNDNIYTGDISDISDIKYVNVFNFDYNFNTDKSIISDYTNSTALVCFYKNKGTTIFSSGRYNEGIINFSDKTFYKCSDLDHNFNVILGFKSSSSFFGPVNVLLNIDENWGLKINFYDVYNVVDSLWIYVKNNILYIKTNTDILYSRTFVNLTFEFSIYDKKIVVDSKNILSTIISAFLPYNFFIYGGVNDIQIVAKSFMPMTFEGTGKVIDDIYGDAYCITGEIESFGYLKSIANNVLTSSEVFAFDIACRSLGQSIPFSISNNVSFDSSGFIMNDSCVWICIDTTISGFIGNILTSSGIVTVSGVLSSVNDYYLVRCYYDGSKFGVIVNGEDAHINCNNTVLSGSNLNILTNNFLSIDSFAFYDDSLPSLELYNAYLTKFNSVISDTALVNSNNKILFAADNFYTNSASYTGLFYNNWKIPLTYTTNTFYTNCSIAGGEVFLDNDNFYANKSLFNESVYNCFICENDKSFLTYFSGITVPANKILAESFTNYGYVSENFITTNSGLYIRNCSKVFDRISNTISIVEFSNIGWSKSLNIGVLFNIDNIPIFPNENCAVVTCSGELYIGATLISGLNINDNTSIYFYLDNFNVLISGSNTGVIGSGIITTSYSYVKYFISNESLDFAFIDKIYISTAQKIINTLTNKFFSYELPKQYVLDSSYKELFYNIENNVSSSGIILYDHDFYDHQCSFSSYYGTTFSGMFNVFDYNFLGIDDNFENGFITERWRLICDPYGVYSCNQPGWISVKTASSNSSPFDKNSVYNDNVNTAINNSSSFTLSNGIYYQINFYETQLVDSIDLYITSFNTNPKDGFTISCNIYAYYNSIWNTLIDNYVSPVLSGTIMCSSDDKAVFNVNDKNDQITLNDNNLKAINDSTGFHNVRSNICNNYGKWYWEITAGNVSGTNDYKIGIADLDADLDSQLATSGIYAYAYNQDGTKQHNGSTVYGDSYTSEDVIGVALDLSIGKIWWSKNGIWQNSGNPASGINEAFNGISGDWYPVQGFYDNNNYCTANFGNSFFVYPIPDGFNSGIYSCTFVWPTHHIIYIPPVRCTEIKIVANDNWGETLPTEIRPSCFCNHGGTAICITSSINNDNFNKLDNSSLNDDIWNIYKSDNSTIKIEDNKLHYTLTTNGNSEYTYVVFKYNLTGNFDVQCDFLNLIGGNELNDTYFELRFKVDDFNDVFIKTRFPLDKGFEGRFTICGVINSYHNIRVNSYGKLRLVRHKNTITTYYIDGNNNWVINCFRDRFSTMDGKIILGLYAPKNSGDVSVDVDNFLLNVKTLASRINNNDTNLYVVLDDILQVYAEYTLEDKFSLSFSGINYYPLNSKMYLKSYSEKECYIRTSWTTYSCCNIIASSKLGDLITTISGIFGKVEYFFNISRFLDIITISGSFVDTDASINSNYSFSSDNLNLELLFYNESISNAIGSGCLFGIESDYYTVSFSSISTGYKYTALDDTNNMTKAGIGFNTYPPNLFINKIQGECVGQSYKVYNKLIASGIQLSLNAVDNCVSIEAKDIGCIGGIKQVSKFNRLSLFSSYLFELSALYKFYCVGKDQQYLTFSEIANIVNTGDKVYFYSGMYNINTDKQLTLIGVGNPADIKLQINNASAGLIVIGCTTTECAGSNVFNMYNCYILPWTFHISENSAYTILYNVRNINFYNCDLYNYAYMSYNTSYALLNKCTVYRTKFYYGCYYEYENITIYNEGYVTHGCYGYGPEFNRSSVISGLSSVNFIIMSSFYHNSIYNHFPLNNQIAIKEDKCNQLILSTDTYSVYFYGDIKKLNSFSMYIFIQDIVGTLEITNSSDFIIVINPNDLDSGIHFTLNVYNAVVDIVIPIPYSSVFKLSIISIVFNGGSISIYLNGSKLATKYIIIADFNDINSYLNNSIIFFDENKFVCTGNGLLLKGASLSENIHFLVGTHVEELYSNYTTTITVNMELSTDPILMDYHNLGTSIYYGYSCNNTGVGLYYDTANWEYKHIYFNANKSYKIYKNIVKTYIGSYRYFDYQTNTCQLGSDTEYLSPQKNHTIKFGAARIDNKSFGYCYISEAYGYVNIKLQLPLPVIDRSLYCFDILNSIITLSFDLSSDPYVHDVGPNSLNTYWHNDYYGYVNSVTGIFHNSVIMTTKEYYYVQHDELLNLTKNFTIELLFTYFNQATFDKYLLTKGTISYNIAYRVGISNRHIPYFVWSWEGDNILYAEKPIYTDKPVYLVVIIGEQTVSFYINGTNAGVKRTNKLTIINNIEDIKIIYGYDQYNYQLAMEEICILNKIKIEKEILMTWEKISGGEKAPWIKINNVVVISDEPIKVSPSDRGNSSNGLLDTSKWDYVAYKHPKYSNGIILDSRTSSKLISKVVSYNVIFDVSVFCEFLEYSISRNWSVTFKYKFASGNYMSVVIDYVKYDDIYIKCEYYYNGYKGSTNRTKLILSPCGIRFVTDYNKYTYVQIGDWSYWYTLWKSTQNLFIETSGRLEIVLSNDDWDSWFIIKITNFLPRLYCDTIPDDTSLNFYESLPYGRAFYSQIPDNVASLCLSNSVFKVTANGSCTHSLEFINGNMSNTHVFDTVNRIFENINYSIFNIELLVYLTYDNTDILNLFPWISLDVRNKYLYITMHDNTHTITDSINEFFNDYIYIAISISNPHTILYINDKKFVYDTDFTEILPYYFYPIGKEFSGRVVYFCGYYGEFDRDGYTFRVSTLSRYIGFDACARKIFGNNMATSIDPYSIIYSYDNPSYSSMLVSKGCGLDYGNDVDVNILFDPSILQASISVFIAIRCKYSNLNGKKTTSITISCVRHNVSHNYYDSFGDIGNSQEVFSYDLVGTCYNEYSIFILSISKEILENILTGTAILNIKNNNTNIITNIYIYLNSELGVNDIYGSALLV